MEDWKFFNKPHPRPSATFASRALLPLSIKIERGNYINNGIGKKVTPFSTEWSKGAGGMRLPCKTPFQQNISGYAKDSTNSPIVLPRPDGLQCPIVNLFIRVHSPAFRGEVIHFTP